MAKGDMAQAMPGQGGPSNPPGVGGVSNQGSMDYGNGGSGSFPMRGIGQGNPGPMMRPGGGFKPWSGMQSMMPQMNQGMGLISSWMGNRGQGQGGQQFNPQNFQNIITKLRGQMGAPGQNRYMLPQPAQQAGNMGGGFNRPPMNPFGNMGGGLGQPPLPPAVTANPNWQGQTIPKGPYGGSNGWNDWGMGNGTPIANIRMGMPSVPGMPWITG